MIQEEYFDNLVKQFCQSSGCDIIPYYYCGLLPNGFRSWLDRLPNRTKNYTEILKQLKCNYNSLECAEIGKGPLDTMVKPKHKTYLITPYADSFKSNQNLLMNGYFYDDGFKSYINKYHSIKESDIFKDESIPGTISLGRPFNLFVIHNPYNLSDLEFMENAACHGCSIYVGMFGDIHDLDKEKKLKCLKELRETLESYGLIGLVREYNKTIFDSYYSVLYLDREYQYRRI